MQTVSGWVLAKSTKPRGHQAHIASFKCSHNLGIEILEGNNFRARMRKKILDLYTADTKEITVKDYCLEVHCHRV